MKEQFYILAKRSGSLYGLPNDERPLKSKGKIVSFATEAEAVEEAKALNKAKRSYALSYHAIDEDGDFLWR